MEGCRSAVRETGWIHDARGLISESGSETARPVVVADSTGVAKGPILATERFAVHEAPPGKYSSEKLFIALAVW
jgi:hypothetical protein